MSATDAFDLNRFIDAQNGIYESALIEITQGQKCGHWMWFIFPQLAGLGSSAMARHYAIASLPEAQAYLAHPELGPRLWACAAAAARHLGLTAAQVFGHPDDLKLRSSMTLFEVADPREPVFRQVLEALCGGQRDAETLHLLGISARND